MRDCFGSTSKTVELWLIEAMNLSSRNRSVLKNSIKTELITELNIKIIELNYKFNLRFVVF